MKRVVAVLILGGCAAFVPRGGATAKDDAKNWLTIRGPHLSSPLVLRGDNATDFFFGVSGLDPPRPAFAASAQTQGLGPRYQVKYFIAVEGKPVVVQRLDLYPFAVDGLWSFHPSQRGGPYSAHRYPEGWWHPHNAFTFKEVVRNARTPSGQTASTGTNVASIIVVGLVLAIVGVLVLLLPRDSSPLSPPSKVRIVHTASSSLANLSTASPRG